MHVIKWKKYYEVFFPESIKTRFYVGEIVVITLILNMSYTPSQDHQGNGFEASQKTKGLYQP